MNFDNQPLCKTSVKPFISRAWLEQGFGTSVSPRFLHLRAFLLDKNLIITHSLTMKCPATIDSPQIERIQHAQGNSNPYTPQCR